MPLSCPYGLSCPGAAAFRVSLSTQTRLLEEEGRSSDVEGPRATEHDVVFLVMNSAAYSLLRLWAMRLRGAHPVAVADEWLRATVVFPRRRGG